MLKIKTLEDLLIQEIKDLYSAENQLVKALPKMVKAASDPPLRDAFTTHLKETKEHVERLENVAKLLGATPRGKTCKAMEGLIEEGAEVIQEESDPKVKDLALIIAAQKVEHYEISGYGSAKALAKSLELEEIVELLQTNEEEEVEADSGLTAIAEDIITSIQSTVNA